MEIFKNEKTVITLKNAECCHFVTPPEYFFSQIARKFLLFKSKMFILAVNTRGIRIAIQIGSYTHRYNLFRINYVLNMTVIFGTKPIKLKQKQKQKNVILTRTFLYSNHDIYSFICYKVYYTIKFKPYIPL